MVGLYPFSSSSHIVGRGIDSSTDGWTGGRVAAREQRCGRRWLPLAVGFLRGEHVGSRAPTSASSMTPAQSRHRRKGMRVASAAPRRLFARRGHHVRYRSGLPDRRIDHHRNAPVAGIDPSQLLISPYDVVAERQQPERRQPTCPERSTNIPNWHLPMPQALEATARRSQNPEITTLPPVGDSR